MINPCQKPKKLWQHLMTALLPPCETDGDVNLILDLTSGSGSLTMSAACSGYSSIALESDENQFKDSKQYLRAALTAGKIVDFDNPEDPLQDESDQDFSLQSLAEDAEDSE